MLRRVVLSGTLLSVVLTGGVFGQLAQQKKLATYLPALYGGGITLADQTHQAHFANASTQSLRQFNTSMTIQLSSLPLTSPASSSTYAFDPTLGTVSRSAQSFGPILAERAETIGKNRTNIGFSFQHFGFDSIEGMDLQAIPTVLSHDASESPYARDLITTTGDIDLSVDQFTMFLSYGLTDSLDVSVALPVVRSELNIRSTAEVQRIGSGTDTSIHQFVNGVNSWTTSGDASGIGDIIIRGKGTVFRWENGGVALAGDLRLPTGDEQNLLGAGAVGFKPFAAVSLTYGMFSPHVNVGYQWNGDSVLAGDIEKGTKGKLPDQFLYTAGVDLGLHPRVTVAFDLLGQRIIDSQRVIWIQVPGGTQSFTNFDVRKDSFSVHNGAAGVKLNPFKQLLIDFNVIFAMDDAGLRDDATPLIGVSYNF